MRNRDERDWGLLGITVGGGATRRLLPTPTVAIPHSAIRISGTDA